MNIKIIKTALLLIAIAILTNCASGYKMIEPKTINYISSTETDNVKLDYKYGLLHKKYAKKEVKKGTRLVALKITNNSDRDLTFGKDAILTYANGKEVFVMENERVFTTLKQSPASYLWYLLLTPLNFYSSQTSSNGVQERKNTFPVGLIVGPGLAGGNMIAANSANSKFKTELLNYNLNGTVVKQGDTLYGLIGIKTNYFDALKLKIQ